MSVNLKSSVPEPGMNVADACLNRAWWLLHPSSWMRKTHSQMLGLHPQSCNHHTASYKVMKIERLTGLDLSKLWEVVKDREAWRAAAHRVAKSWRRPSEWATKQILANPATERPVRCSVYSMSYSLVSVVENWKSQGGAGPVFSAYFWTHWRLRNRA